MSQIETAIVGHLLLFALVFARVCGMTMLAPVFSAPEFPIRFRLALAGIVSLAIVPVVGSSASNYSGPAAVGLDLASEAAVGLVLGLGVSILLSGVRLAGQLIAQVSGFSLAEVYDPSTDSNVSIFSQFFGYMTVALFVAIGGHRLVTAALLDTLQAIPPGRGAIDASAIEGLVTILGQSFALGVRVAAPALASLLLATIVLGLIGRTLPQLGTMTVGLGLNAMIALAAVFLSMGGAAWILQDELAHAIDLMTGAMVRG